MKNHLLAIALTVALPAMAGAQAAPAAPKAACPATTNDSSACKDGMAAHAAAAVADPHAGHDMSKMDHAHDAKDVADPHAGHDMTKPMATPSAASATLGN